MAAGTLYTYPKSFRANKVLIAAEYSGADVKVDKDFKLGESNKSTDFLKKFPNGKVPAFEGKDGFCLSESNAIAHYVSNSELCGEDKQCAAKIQQWINFSDNEILPAACTWVFPCLGIIQYNKQETEQAKEQVKKVLKVLNDHLLTRTFMVLERVTLADISLVCNLQSLYEQVLEPQFRQPYQNVNRWFTTMINQPAVKSVLGEVTLCTKMAVFDNKKFKDLHGGGDEKKKEKKTQPQQQPKKEKAKQAAQPAQEEEPPKPKESKDPFEKFPKGKFDMDEFKRTYSNNDIETIAIPYFWEHFEKDNYSIWFCEYTEKTASQQFMNANLVTGMFQRLEKMRKNSFGSMLILKGDKYAIQGLWFWRGHELAFDLCSDWQTDYESYKWTKLNPDEEKTKELVKSYFTHGEEKYDGKEFTEGKIFK